jgi:peptide/nickel transport system permease protein
MERIESTVAPRVGTTTLDGGDQDEVDLIPVRTYWMLVRQRFLAHRLAVIALFLMATLVILAIVVPTVTGNEYKATSLSESMLPPSLEHPLGTNQIGQDMFLRLMKGLQTSLLIGFMSVAIIGAIGVTLGSISGFYGGKVDNIIMRLVDVVLSLPVFFVILMIVAVLGKGSAAVVIIAIGLTGWTLACRLVRAEFLKLREADFVQAGRALGASNRRIISRHILPASLAPVVVAATLGIADSVVAEAALSFLGFGISPPDASLGNLLKNFDEDLQVRPWLLVPPAVTIVLVVLAASFLGDGLRDALDPRQRVESK